MSLRLSLDLVKGIKKNINMRYKTNEKWNKYKDSKETAFINSIVNFGGELARAKENSNIKQKSKNKNVNWG